MNDMWKVALMQLIGKVGLDLAIEIATQLNKATTIDDAIAALQETRKKAWKDYVAEA